MTAPPVTIKVRRTLPGRAVDVLRVIASHGHDGLRIDQALDELHRRHPRAKTASLYAGLSHLERPRDGGHPYVVPERRQLPDSTIAGRTYEQVTTVYVVTGAGRAWLTDAGAW